MYLMRRAAVIVTLIVMALTFFAINPHKTFAAAMTTSCSAAPSTTNCDHQDPGSSAEGCTGNYTVEPSNGGAVDIYDTLDDDVIGLVELRYSTTCKSNWSRVTNLACDSCGMSWTIYRQSDGASDGGGGGITDIGDEYWSGMLYAPVALTKACGSLSETIYTGQVYTFSNCTGWL